MKKRNPTRRVSSATRVNGMIALEWKKRSRAAVFTDKKKQASKNACREHRSSFFTNSHSTLNVHYIIKIFNIAFPHTSF